MTYTVLEISYSFDVTSVALSVLMTTVGRFVTSDHTVLEKAKKAVRQNLLRTLLLEAKSLGITKDELLQFIQKEDIL